ncbi:MAG TPA: type IV pilus secretin PilQ [Myxococcota bacterium]|nr:type IV pilus secretin PilQ [Myxococcota bacterium]
MMASILERCGTRTWLGTALLAGLLACATPVAETRNGAEGSAAATGAEQDGEATLGLSAADGSEGDAWSERMASAGDAPAGPPATQLVGIEVRESEQGTLVDLRTDGSLAKVDAFVLENPARLVVDLEGISQAETPARVEVGGANAARIRVGEHADKVRVVIDGGDRPDPFAGFRTVNRADGLSVWLGGAEESLASEATVAVEEIPANQAEASELAPAEASEAVAEAPAASEAAAATEPTEGAPQATEPAAGEPEAAELAAETTASPAAPTAMQVYGVELDPQAERQRVAVLSSEPASYELVTLDPETHLVRLHGATIDPKAAVRIAPEDGGSLSLVTAFQQPDMSTPEVRVVVTHAAGLEPQVTQQGTVLWLDFPRGAAAPPLPVTTMAESAASQAASTPAAAAAPASAKAVARAQRELAPASLDPGAGGLEILNEGGLVDGKSYVGRRISLDFKDVEVADVLRLIAEVSDLNVIAGDEVDGKITIRLVDVPWDQALDVVLLTKGLGFVRVGNVLRVAPSERLKQEEEARLQERRAKEKLEDLVVKLQPVNYAEVKSVSTMVKRLLTPRGTVDVDKRTNTIIIKDIGSVIDEATALIKAIDTQTPQVLIEAKIVEARLDFSREIGATWAFGAQPFEGADALGGEDFLYHNDPQLTGFTDSFNNVAVSNPITSVANGLLDLGAFILDEQFNLELRLEAAESSGDGKVISSPRVVTLDNSEATIKQGVAIPFQTFENGDAQLEFIDAVLQLKVTPHITSDRSIIMKVDVQRNAPEVTPNPTGSPSIAKNEAKTETLVKDGQTLVIGGIYVIDKSENTGGVPYFNRIPVIGAAFRNREVRDRRNELLIFMTPRVVVVPEAAS